MRRCTWPIRLVEVQPRAALGPDRLKEAEAKLLLAAAPAGTVMVALDERGRDLSSGDLAQRLGAWRDQGRRNATFLIGGADGLAPVVAPQPNCAWPLAARPGRIGWSG